MEHNDMRHKLSEYLDGSITAQEQAEIEAHLRTCQECETALNDLRKTIEQIKAIEEIEPPAWMTQKIMAKVRAEAEEKKSIFQRLFYPLIVKQPIQAVAVLFLAVTAFYIYQDIHPTAKYSESPLTTTQELALKKEAPPSAIEQGKQNEADESLLRSKQAPQAPGYKALDMKQEYEAPASPKLKDQIASSAPAPAKPAEQLVPEKKVMTAEKRAAAPLALSKAEMQEQNAAAGAAPPMEAKREVAVQTRKTKTALTADSNACFSYEPTVVTATGVISKRDFPGRPNYENIAKGDEREIYWVLKLNKTACVIGNKENALNEPEPLITDIQLVLDSAQYDKYRSLLNTPVAVTGTLFHAHTGHHHTPVLIKVSEMSPRGK